MSLSLYTIIIPPSSFRGVLVFIVNEVAFVAFEHSL